MNNSTYLHVFGYLCTFRVMINFCKYIWYLEAQIGLNVCNSLNYTKQKKNFTIKLHENISS